MKDTTLNIEMLEAKKGAFLGQCRFFAINIANWRLDKNFKTTRETFFVANIKTMNHNVLLIDPFLSSLTLARTWLKIKTMSKHLYAMALLPLKY